MFLPGRLGLTWDIALLFLLSISCEQLTADNITCFGFIPRNREEDLPDSMVPHVPGEGWVRVLALPGQGAALCREPSPG